MCRGLPEDSTQSWRDVKTRHHTPRKQISPALHCISCPPTVILMTHRKTRIQTLYLPLISPWEDGSLQARCRFEICCFRLAIYRKIQKEGDSGLCVRIEYQKRKRMKRDSDPLSEITILSMLYHPRSECQKKYQPPYRWKARWGLPSVCPLRAQYSWRCVRSGLRTNEVCSGCIYVLRDNNCFLLFSMDFIFECRHASWNICPCFV